MKNILAFLFLLILFHFANGQPQAKRYKDSMFSASNVITVEYGSNVDYLGRRDTLYADIYTPDSDSATNRALIIYVHGGGFNFGHRYAPAIVEACNKITKKGFVAASIEYRLGVDRTNGGSMIKGLIRAIQDLNGFIRYAKANADKLNIDTNKIFISGSSAGAITVLNKAYMKMDSAAARYGVYSSADLEGNSNNLPNTSTVAGVYSMWGAILDTSWIQDKDIPVGCVQSLRDPLIPWISGHLDEDPSITLFGSYSIYTRARNAGLLTSIHWYESNQHDLGLKVAPYKDTTIQLMTDFFSQIIYATDSVQQQKQDNTFLSKTYLVKNSADNKKYLSHREVDAKKKEQ